MIFYIVCPYINKLIKELTKKELLFLSIFMFTLYSIMNTIKGKMFFTSEIIVFTMIYICIAYMKKYTIKAINNKKLNIAIAITSIISYILFAILLNVLGTKYKIFSDKMLYFVKIENVLFLLLAFSLFNLFRSRSFFYKKINNLSKLTLYIYVIHENYLFRTYIRPYFFVFIKEHLGYDLLPLWTILSAILLFTVSAILSRIYKATLHKVVVKFVDNNIYEKLKRVYMYNRFIDKVMEIK